jgi:RNAse (barnase) inhibitor barstar
MNNHPASATILEQIQNHILTEDSKVIHDFMSYLSSKMTEMNQEKQNLVNGFLTWLEKEIIQGPIEGFKNKTKISKFYENNFNSLVDVLKQNHILPKVIALHNERYEKVNQAYNDTMSKLVQLMEIICKTDNLIDQIIYKLYCLTDEEIKIVEKSYERE